MTKLAALVGALHRAGFAHADAFDMQALLQERGLARWDEFAATWENLGADTYMADGGRYRRRRYGAWSVSAEQLRRKPHQPHYQSRDYNALNGGIERWFEPILEETGDHPAMQAALRAGYAIFTAATAEAARPPSWHVEVHQFRIETRDDETGRPTPEGLHRDGVDWVMVMLVRRTNVDSGETSIHGLRREQLGNFVLTAPMEAALVDDNRVYHGVTPVVPIDPALPAFRDVLVLTFRRE